MLPSYLETLLVEVNNQIEMYNQRTVITQEFLASFKTSSFEFQPTIEQQSKLNCQIQTENTELKILWKLQPAPLMQHVLCHKHDRIFQTEHGDKIAGMRHNKGFSIDHIYTLMYSLTVYNCSGQNIQAPEIMFVKYPAHRILQVGKNL